MSVPENLRFAKSHEWVREESDGEVLIGISDYAQDQLGDVVFVELPEVGATIDAGGELGTMESVKAVSEFYAPVAGEVVAVNERLQDEPELVNASPFGEGWLVRLAASGQEGDLMTAAEYEQFLEEESQ